MDCSFCGAPIPPEVLARRHISSARVQQQRFCNQECLAEWRKQHDFFRQMSHAGATQRTEALRRSNRINPRKGSKKPRCKNCGDILPDEAKKRGPKRIYCNECGTGKNYRKIYYRRRHPPHPPKKRTRTPPEHQSLVSSQANSEREYHRWYRRLIRLKKPLGYWLERDKRKQEREDNG